MSVFKKFENKWFNVHKNADNRPDIARQRFLKGVLLSLVFIGVIVFIQIILLKFSPNRRYYFQVGAVTIALIATFCRAGWDIQSYKGKTPIERIDRGMFTISYLGSTCILLFILIL